MECTVRTVPGEDIQMHGTIFLSFEVNQLLRYWKRGATTYTVDAVGRVSFRIERGEGKRPRKLLFPHITDYLGTV